MRKAVSLLTTLFLAVILSSQSVAHIGHFGEYAPAKMYDVRTFDVDCVLGNETCASKETTHFIEYFSADWCEPCELVSQELKELNRTDTTIIQHHPSPADLHFYSDSTYDCTKRMASGAFLMWFSMVKASSLAPLNRMNLQQHWTILPVNGMVSSN